MREPIRCRIIVPVKRNALKKMKTETTQNLVIALAGLFTVALLVYCSLNGIGY